MLAVIIATKNRSEALRKYALPSLGRSSFENFVCIVWDASDDEKSRKVVEMEERPFPMIYRKAPRAGSSSQRNDAVEYVLKTYEDVRYVVFIDDDCELSEDALEGAVATFREKGAAIVNIPMHPLKELSKASRLMESLKRLLGMDRHGAFPFLYNYGAACEPPGIEVEWASGGGMAVDIAVFRDDGFRFSEAFQRFGGYALGEDFAFSYYVFKKQGGRIVNSMRGFFLHYAAGSARLDIERMAAAKWYNFHLLYDALNGGCKGPRAFLSRASFKAFMWVAALKLLIRARSPDFPAVLRGVASARKALREYRERENIENLMRRPLRMEE